MKTTAAHAYVFLKKQQTGIKYTPVNGAATIATMSGNTNHFKVNLGPQNTHILYFALAMDYPSKKLYYYKNGKLIGIQSVTTGVSDEHFFLGSCQKWCSPDFEGNIYAFKWSNSLKTTYQVKDTWFRGRIK